MTDQTGIRRFKQREAERVLTDDRRECRWGIDDAEMEAAWQRQVVRKWRKEERERDEERKGKRDEGKQVTAGSFAA